MGFRKKTSFGKNRDPLPLSLTSQMCALKVVPFCSLLLKLPLWPVILFLAVLMVRPVYVSSLVVGGGEGLIIVGHQQEH